MYHVCSFNSQFREFCEPVRVYLSSVCLTFFGSRDEPQEYYRRIDQRGEVRQSGDGETRGRS